MAADHHRVYQKANLFSDIDAAERLLTASNPGELLSEYPLFCTKEAENGVYLDKFPTLNEEPYG
ncbi:hypothetical protein [Microbulbifer sp. A4B17]|uniref:hypothetical protein n=1 Tax=Microbulbifer sp. A4B17 TaxID=359370 RepID=UPI001300AC17|nr:hypothetical protein [Microbulbifer sp. A4B17]